MARETVSDTINVAGLLSVVCSALVASSAVMLRPQQAENKDLDRKKNILEAAGLFEEGKSTEEQFQEFEIKIVDLATGEFRDDIDAATFDQRKAARSDETGVAIAKENDLGGIKRRSLTALVYVSLDGEGGLRQLILPVHGKGLWSTLYGFLALSADGSTVRGITFYEHGETAGLGAEVDNPKWKAIWPGKQVFDESGKIRLEVIRGSVLPSSPNVQYEVDGISGATITSKGVSNLIHYWLGPDAFGPFLEHLHQKKDPPSDA